MCTIKSKTDQCKDAYEECAENPSANPRVGSSSPAKTDQEKNHSSSEKKHSSVIELFQLLSLGLSLDVELAVGWWVVEELVECESNDGEDDAEIV